jgi:non-specific serine/threonine protein kinase
VPDFDEPSTVAQLEQNPSVQLFTERARAVQPRFALTARNAPAVAQICRRLDGMPLALELAAARVDSLTAHQLAMRLDQRFSLLTGGSRAALPRQQTLAATLDWSYDLLSNPERHLFERLVVFAGGWTLEAAEAVCAGVALAVDDVLDLLAQLIRKSLVVADETADGFARYTLLETVREYARQKLTARGGAELAALRGRHAGFYSAMADRLNTMDLTWDTTGPYRSADRDTPGGQLTHHLEVDHDNLNGALAWWLEVNRPIEGLRLANALGRFWTRGGLYVEGRHWWVALLDLADRKTRATEPGQPASSESVDGAMVQRLQAGALYGLGLFANQQGDYQQALTYTERSAAIFHQLNDGVALASALCIQGLALWNSGELAQASELIEESRRVLHASPDRGEATRDCASQILRYLGLVARSQQRYQQAADLFRDSMGQATWGYARVRATSALGRVAYLQGDVSHAASLLLEALEVIRDDGLGGHSLANCLEYLAATTEKQGQPVRAAVLFGAAEAQWQASGAVRYQPDRAAYERDLADVQAQLEPGAFVAAWAQGQAMTAEKAIACALDRSNRDNLPL